MANCALWLSAICDCSVSRFTSFSSSVTLTNDAARKVAILHVAKTACATNARRGLLLDGVRGEGCLLLRLARTAGLVQLFAIARSCLRALLLMSSFCLLPV